MAFHPLVATAAALLPLIGTYPLAVAQQSATQTAAMDVIAAKQDRNSRMTVPVTIGNKGPFAFLVDTGAEHTVLARDVAQTLGLAPSNHATVVGVAGSQQVDVVDIDQIDLGRRSFYSLAAPLLDGATIGADGIIGLDSLRDQRVLLDFVHNRMVVGDAAQLGGNQGFDIVVRVRSKSGQLIMTDAVIDGVRTAVMIDTGSDTSIGNRALQRALERHHQGEKMQLTSVTGQTITADIGLLRSMKLDGMTMTNTELVFADAPTFDRLGFSKRPAMLLGMNQLRLFHRVAIDFAARRILFALPDGKPATMQTALSDAASEAPPR